MSHSYCSYRFFGSAVCVKSDRIKRLGGSLNTTLPMSLSGWCDDAFYLRSDAGSVRKNKDNEPWS